MRPDIDGAIAIVEQLKRSFHKVQGRRAFLLQRTSSLLTHLRPPNACSRGQHQALESEGINKFGETHIPHLRKSGAGVPAIGKKARRLHAAGLRTMDVPVGKERVRIA